MSAIRLRNFLPHELESMYQLHWTLKSSWQTEPEISEKPVSKLDRRNVRKALFVNWEEHCVECAPPECYKSCPLYIARADGICARFAYGIYPDRSFSGLYAFGADIRFRRWAKLEADLRQVSLPMRPFFHGILQKLIAVSPRMHSIFYQLRRIKRLLKLESKNRFDEFVVEFYSPQDYSFNLILEGYWPQDDRKEIKFRFSFSVQPGMNFYTLPASRFDLQSCRYIYIYPDNNDRECRLIFTWLDFVQYKKGVKLTEAQEKRSDSPAAKIKCVAWDLDNTVWNGILAEAEPEQLKLKPGIKEFMEALDKRGIVQTVVSKNNHEDALTLVEKFGLRDYFVYPAINWGQKSENLKAVAARLNLNLDTFALIDDSAFERAEVTSALPQIRAYSDTQINTLLSLPEFDSPVTEEGRNRRLSYLAEMRREKIKESFAGDYDDFLAGCQMEMRIFAPRQPVEITRCLELIQRSNQLNLSTRRYTEAEFAKLLTEENILCLAFRCRDKFGDYGIVGFVSIEESGSEPRVSDFVLSCRVAQKKVEPTFFQWLAKYYHGKSRLLADFVPTAKNRPLLLALEESKFKKIGEEGDKTRFALNLAEPILSREIISVIMEKDLSK